MESVPYWRELVGLAAVGLLALLPLCAAALALDPSSAALALLPQRAAAVACVPDLAALALLPQRAASVACVPELAALALLAPLPHPPAVALGIDPTHLVLPGLQDLDSTTFISEGV